MIEDHPRVALVRVDRAMLARILRFPEGTEVAAVHFDAEHDMLLLRVEGPMMPRHHPEAPLLRIALSYRERPAKEGERMVELASFGDWP